MHIETRFHILDFVPREASRSHPHKHTINSDTSTIPFLFHLKLLQNIPLKASTYTSQDMAFSKKPPLGEVGDVDRIVLYFGHHGVDPTAVQKMVEMKIGSKRCDAKRQAVIKDLAKEWFDLQDPKWMWDDVNIGIYIAWGLSKEEDLDRVIELTEAEIDALKPASLPFARARLI